MLKVSIEEQEKLATSYADKASNNINEKSMLFDAYLAGMHKQHLIDDEEVKKIISKAVLICLYNLSANFTYPDHVDYVKYLLDGGTDTEEEWFTKQCYSL